MSRPYTIKDCLHRDPALSILIEKQGSDYFMAVNTVKPSTATIYNQAINNDNWTAIATGLTDVLEWRMSERAGQDFYFAFGAAPATYATAFGWVGGQQSIGAIYAKRKNAVANNIELLIWTK
jgi:hypothetical protein